MTILLCSLCCAPIPATAPRSVADDDTVWCADCYETAMHPGERPAPTVPVESTYKIASAHHRLVDGARHRALRGAVDTAAEYADTIARFVREVLPDDAGRVRVDIHEDGADVVVTLSDGSEAALTLEAHLSVDGRVLPGSTILRR